MALYQSPGALTLTSTTCLFNNDTTAKETHGDNNALYPMGLRTRQMKDINTRQKMQPLISWVGICVF